MLLQRLLVIFWTLKSSFDFSKGADYVLWFFKKEKVLPMRIFLFFIILHLSILPIFCDPLIVVVLMVKNEASVMVKTLQPFVDAGINDYVIFDTGSTDGTQQITKDFFAQYPVVKAYIEEEPFIDFATSRNNALDRAQQLFPDATFMLMPDAEWYLRNGKELVQFCREHEHDSAGMYLFDLHCPEYNFYTGRILRCKNNIRFVGAVHEMPNSTTGTRLPSSIYFEWLPSSTGKEKTAARWERDRDLLLKDYERNSSDARTLFYLGQTYFHLDDLQKSKEFFEKRALVHGWDQEDFMATLYLGELVEALGLKDEAGLFSLAVGYYLKAYGMRPHRAEPLVRLARYYFGKKDMYTAYLFASKAAKLAYPVQDSLFIEKRVYDFDRYDVLGACAWFVGEYEVGEQAVRQALKVEPQNEQLKRNLAVYVERKESAARAKKLKSASVANGDFNK